MTRIPSVSRRLIDENLEVPVSASHVTVENHYDLRILSGIDGVVSFRIKPDRRSVDTVMPPGRERRRY